MKRVILVVVLLLCIQWEKVPSRQSIVVESYGRSIQVDGFLMEWREEHVDTFSGTVSFMWDIMNTTKGLVGYFRFRYADSCGKIGIRVYPRLSAMHKFQTMDSDTSSIEGLVYAVDKSGTEKDTAVVIEWLLPWELVVPDSSSGEYETGMIAYNGCGDTTEPIILTGSTMEDQGRIINDKIKMQIVSIIVLLALFAVFKMKAQKYKKRRR